LLHHRLDFFV